MKELSCLMPDTNRKIIVKKSKVTFGSVSKR